MTDPTPRRDHRGIKATPLPIDLLRSLAAEGLTAREIADRVGCSRALVYEQARYHRVPLTRDADRHRSRRSPVVERAIVREANRRGITVVEVLRDLCKWGAVGPEVDG